MTLEEKMIFFDGIHTDNVPLFDRDGNDMDTFNDYCDIEKEFLTNPQMFSLDDICSFISKR